MTVLARYVLRSLKKHLFYDDDLFIQGEHAKEFPDLNPLLCTSSYTLLIAIWSMGADGYTMTFP